MLTPGKPQCGIPARGRSDGHLYAFSQDTRSILLRTDPKPAASIAAINCCSHLKGQPCSASPSWAMKRLGYCFIPAVRVLFLPRCGRRSRRCLCWPRGVYQISKSNIIVHSDRKQCNTRPPVNPNISKTKLSGDGDGDGILGRIPGKHPSQSPFSLSEPRIPHERHRATFIELDGT